MRRIRLRDMEQIPQAEGQARRTARGALLELEINVADAEPARRCW